MKVAVQVVWGGGCERLSERADCAGGGGRCMCRGPSADVKARGFELVEEGLLVGGGCDFRLALRSFRVRVRRCARRRGGGGVGGTTAPANRFEEDV